MTEPEEKKQKGLWGTSPRRAIFSRPLGVAAAQDATRVVPRVEQEKTGVPLRDVGFGRAPVDMWASRGQDIDFLLPMWYAAHLWTQQKGGTVAEGRALYDVLEYLLEPPRTEEQWRAYAEWATGDAGWDELPKGALAVELPIGAAYVPGALLSLRDVWKDYRSNQMSLLTLVDVLAGAVPVAGMLVTLIRHGDDIGDAVSKIMRASKQLPDPQSRTVVRSNAGAELVLDPKRGIGAMGLNANINYQGATVWMTPNEFMQLVAPRSRPPGEYIHEAVRSQEGIANPFLDIDFSGDIPAVRTHEGRGRMMAAIEAGFGDVPIPVHIEGKGMRWMDWTAEDVGSLRRIQAERGPIVDFEMEGRPFVIGDPDSPDMGRPNPITYVIEKGKPRALKPPVPEGHVRIYRRTPEQTSLDPTDPGARTGVRAAEDRRRLDYGDDFPARLNYYLEGATPEPKVEGFRYETYLDVPEERMYDLAADPEGFLEKAGGDFTLMEKMVANDPRFDGSINPIQQRADLYVDGAKYATGRIDLREMKAVPVPEPVLRRTTRAQAKRQLGRFADHIETGDDVGVILERDPSAVADAFGLDNVTQAEVDRAADAIETISREGLPEKITVYRAGDQHGDIINVTTEPTVARFFAEQRGLPVESFEISRSDVLSDTGRFTGAFDESELRVRSSALRGAPEIEVTDWDREMSELLNSGHGTTQRVGGGFAPKKERYFVSPDKSTETMFAPGSVTPEAVARFRTEHADALDKGYFGAWVLEDGTVYMDASRGFTNKKDALKVAAVGDQQSIADRHFLPRNDGGLADIEDVEDWNKAFPKNPYYHEGSNRSRWPDERTRMETREQVYDLLPDVGEAVDARMLETMGPETRRWYDTRKPHIQARVREMHRRLLSDEELATVMALGATSRKWYQRQARALRQAYGADADQFLALLAATSPRVPVPSNLRFNMDLWAEWNLWNRPRDPDVIQELFDSVAAGKNLEGHQVIPNANVNVKKVLSHPEPQEYFGDPDTWLYGDLLSGLKVPPFFANLAGELRRATIDTHEGVLGPISALSLSRRAAMEANIGAAADELTRSLEIPEALRHAEGQAMTWEPIRQLQEMAGMGRRSIEDLLFDEAGNLRMETLEELDRRMRGADLAPLYQTDEARELIRRGGGDPDAIDLPPEYGLGAELEAKARQRVLDNPEHLRAFARRMDLSNKGETFISLAPWLAAGGAGLLGSRLLRQQAPQQEEPRGLFDGVGLPPVGGRQTIF